MDRLYLGYPDEQADVDALLSQLNDENLMKLKINSHTSTRNMGYPLENSKWSEDDRVLDSQLSRRFAGLKAPRAGPKAKVTEPEAKKESTGLSLRRSSSKREDVSRGGSDMRRLSRSHSQNSDFLSCRSGPEDDSEDIDANLMARFRALKETPSPNSSDGRFSSSRPSRAASSDYFSNSPHGSSSPSANLLGRSKSRSSPRLNTTSVSTSCHCSTPSPLKLLKQLSSKKLPAKPLPASKASAQSTGDAKLAGKESSKKKKSQEKGLGDEAEALSTVKDVKRLLSSVADRVGLERSRVSSAEEDDCLGGDFRSFSMVDREREYLKASSEEEKLTREAEKVVEWAKDAARLELGEDEDLELADEDLDSDSSMERRIKVSKDLKKTPKKKRWGLF